jgi:phosphoglycerate dehydrogenase-like enzyme
VTSDASLRGPLTVLVLGDLAPDIVERLRAHDSLARFVAVRDASAADRAAAEVLFVWDFRARDLDGLVRSLPALRWLHAASAGVEHILVPAVVESDLLVSNSAGLFEQPIAEYVVALALAHAKELSETARAQRERRWAYREVARIGGATMVIVGMGRIGRAVGRLATALDMTVIGIRRSGPHADDPHGLQLTPDLAAVTPLADYLVVTAALTPETRGLVNAEIVSLLRPTAYVINVARALIVDTSAVVAALRSARLAGAALDVFDEEPLPPDSDLWDVPNLLISPHMAGDTHGFTSGIVDVFAANIGRFVAGEPLANLVDVKRGY